MRKFLKAIWRVITFPFRMIFWIIRLISRGIRGVWRNINALLREEPEDRPFFDSVATAVQDPQGILEHVDAFRTHLLRSVLFLAITTGISFAFTPKIIDFLAIPIGGMEKLVAIEVTEPIGVFTRVALLSGFVMALPYIAFELWLFAAPGMMLPARKRGCMAIPLVVLFFVGGMAFAYLAMLPTALPFLLNFMGLNTQVRPDSYIRFITGLLFWIGVAFEFPLVILVLASLRIIKARILAEQWRLAVVLIALMAAVITPTVDPVSMGLVMAPMIALYFLSIALAHWAQRGDSAQAKKPA